jgi:peptidoglycan/LPS O-acetylase OafA/YrhL/lysophospholipase L1-like esterase
MSQTKIRYLPALDGLRALAVAGVICYHGGLAWAGGGFLGVDAFFVLSGYLITTLLLTEWRSSSLATEWNATGRIDLKAFWARRARRLLPALLLVLGAVAVYAVLVAAPGELRTIRADGIASLFYIANWRFIWSGASYFAQFGAPSPLRHFWSLAIEEQFYLLWPLIVFGILRWRRGSIRALAWFATVAAIGSAVLMWTMYVPGQDPSRVYYGTDTRASSLLVGALLGMVMLRRPVVEGTVNRWILHGAGIVAAVVLGYWWSTATEHSDWLYRGGFVIAAVLVAVVIASITQPKYGPLGRVLALKPLRFIGLISYGLYLWHWPVFIALSPTRVPFDGYALFAVRVAATLTIATLSYYLIEMPIRHGALKRLRLRPVLLTPVVVMVVLAAIVFTTAGAPASPVEVSAAEVKAPKVVDTPTTGPAPPAHVLLVGDSVANSLSPGFEHLAAADNFQVWNASVPGCGLASDLGQRYTAGWESQPPRCAPGWRDRWAAEVAQWNPKVVVVLLGAQDTFDRRVGGKVFPFDQAGGQQLAMGELQQAVNILGENGAQVVFLTAPYYVLGWPEQIVVNRSHLNPAWIDRWNAFLRDTAATNPGNVTVLDLNKTLDPDGHWTDTVDGVTVRVSDRMHLTTQGADLAAQALMPQILPLLHDPASAGGSQKAP